MARQPTSQRLARLLALPAWVAEHPGADIAQAAAHFGVTPTQIEADVNTLWVSGLPGGLPGELVDFDAVDFEAGRLRLAEPLGLDRPVRLSRQEALSLILALRVLGAVLADDADSLRALDSARAALGDLLARGRGNPQERRPQAWGAPTGGTAAGAQDAPDGAQATADATSAVGSDSTPRPTHLAAVLAAVRQALRERRRLHLTYVSATDTPSERQVDPLELTSDGAHLFLSGWCLSAGARRTFRLDRVVSATVLATPAAAHRASRRSRGGGAAQEGSRWSSSGAAPTATLTLRPTGRWLTEQIPCLSVEEQPGGRLRAVVEGRDRDWLVSLVLSAGSHLIAVEPADLARQAAAAARRALNSYGEQERDTGPAPRAGT